MANNKKNLYLNNKSQSLIFDLFDIGAIKFGEFRFKLHEKNPEAPLAPTYMDLRVPRRFPYIKRAIVDEYIELIRSLEFDLLADVPTAATPVVATISDRLGIGMITPRMDSKTHGSGAKIDGLQDSDKGKTAVVIDDLITRADSKFEAIDVLKNAGLKVNDVVVLVDREQGGEDQLKKKGYKLHTAFKLSEILKILVEAGKITDKMYKDILSRQKKLDEYMMSAKIQS